MTGLGVTVPLDRIPLHEHRAVYEELAALGYSDLWSSEVSGTDAFTPLTLAAAWVPSLSLGTAIVPVFTRGPATLAMCAASLAEAAPGRFTLGVGSSSDVIVGRWNGIGFDEPYRRTRDVVRFVKAALTGERVDEQYETFSVRGFRLERPPAVVPPIVVAGLRRGMLRLAGREADGAVVNWLSAEDVRRVAPEVGEGKQVVARIFVCPSEDAEAVRARARTLIAGYLNVGVYAAFHEWLGRGPQLQGMWNVWRAGDRKAALAEIPDGVVDDLFVHGSAEECRAHIARYVANGVTLPMLAVVPAGDVGQMDALRMLARSRA